MPRIEFSAAPAVMVASIDRTIVGGVTAAGLVVVASWTRPAPAASKYRVLVSTVSASAITVVNGAGRAITGQNRMSGFDIGAAAVVIASTDRAIVGGPTAAGIVARASGAVRRQDAASIAE